MRLKYFMMLAGVLSGMVVVLLVSRERLKNLETPSSPAGTMLPVDTPGVSAAGAKLPIEGNEGVNWQQGLTPDQISERLEADVAKRGGRLQVWKANMKRVQGRAERIKNVKLTPELERFLDKVDFAMHECDVLITVAGARLETLFEAKQAYWAHKESHYVAPTKAVLRNNVVYFITDLDAEVDVTLPHHEEFLKHKTRKRPDFSRGWAIKLGEKDSIRLYDWNFTVFPPADGIIGIATEFE